MPCHESDGSVLTALSTGSVEDHTTRLVDRNNNRLRSRFRTEINLEKRKKIATSRSAT
jgi:hypothetical protein